MIVASYYALSLELSSNLDEAVSEQFLKVRLISSSKQAHILCVMTSWPKSFVWHPYDGLREAETRVARITGLIYSTKVFKRWRISLKLHLEMEKLSPGELRPAFGERIKKFGMFTWMFSFSSVVKRTFNADEGNLEEKGFITFSQLGKSFWI